MSHRALVSAGLCLAVLVWTAASAAAQQAYTPPRTPDGQPDLQGFWSNSTYVPLQRPRDVDREFYTIEEFDARVAAAAERDLEQTEPGTVADVHYDFAQFGLRRSQTDFTRDLRTSLIIDPPDGRLPPTNAAGERRAAEQRAARQNRGGQYDRVQNMPAGSRCIIMGGAGPPLRDAGYNANYQIVQGKDHVMILTEMIHDVRIIPLNDRPAPPEELRQWIGVSRGHWEGDTLVVETTNFNGQNAFNGSSPNMKVTERFRRVSDEEIDYTFTIEDPETWDRPWTARAPLTKTVGPIFEFACHETNYGVTNILAGARAEEAAQAAASSSSGGAN